MTRNTDVVQCGIPSKEWERFDLWVSRDRHRKVGFRVRGTACVLELTGKAQVPTHRVEFTLDELRAVARGGRTCGGGEAITAAFGTWGGSVEFRVRADIPADFKVSLGRYVVLIAWLAHKARVNRQRERRFVA